MTNDAHGRPTASPLAFTPPDVRALSHAERARTLVAAQRTGALGTLALEPAGHPYVSYVTFALEGAKPIFCLSRIAEHGKNLAADERVSLLVSESASEDPLANARVTLLGRARVVGGDARTSLRSSFVAAHPHAAHYVDYEDFSFYTLELESLRYIGGYGRMSWVSVEDFARAEPDPLVPFARGILSHMNEDHADALLLYAHALTEARDATTATMTAIDRYGFEMSVSTPRGRGPARIAFERPIETSKDARTALVALVARARGGETLGKNPYTG